MDNKKKSARLLLYMLISTALLVYISYFSAFPVMEPMGLVAIGIFCTMYSLILENGNFVLRILPIAVSVAVIAFVFTPKDFISSEAIICIVNLVAAFALAVTLKICAGRKTSSCVTFTALSVVSAMYILALIVVIIYDAYKTISLDTIKQAIDDAAAFIGSIFSTIPEELTAATGTYYSAAYADLLKEYGKTMAITFKLMFPTLIAGLAMCAAAVVGVFYKPFVKLAGMTEECMDGREMEFNPSGVSAVFFEITFIVYLILMLFSENTVLNTAFMNLALVLSVPFSYVGLRYLARALKIKLGNKVAAVIVVLAVTACLFMFMGSMVFVLAAFIGSSSVGKQILNNKSK